MQDLGRLLFLKRTVFGLDGIKHTYVVGAAETRATLRQCASPQQRLLISQWTPAGTRPHGYGAAGHHEEVEGVFTFLQSRNRRSRATAARLSALLPQAVENKHVSRRKHSRFGRHMRLFPGSKQLAEMISFTSKIDIDMLRRLASGALRPEEHLLLRIGRCSKCQSASLGICQC